MKTVATQGFALLGWGRNALLARHSAFTLAEVLITLGIIGIVAAMTIPTLITNNQEKGWSTAATVFERKLEESLKVMNTQQTLAGYSTTESFVDELSKHIKIVKTCKNTELDKCFPKTFTYGFPETETMDITSFTDSSKLRKEPYGTNTVGLQFANGVVAVMAYDPKCKQDPFSNQITGTSCISMIYDTSGFKSPNTSNKDLRMLNVNTLFAFKVGGTKYSAPFFSNFITKTECAQINIADYGIENCYFNIGNHSLDGDYWAGAVIECGGVDKLPTDKQLAEIATYLYGRTIQEGGETFKCPRDKNYNFIDCINKTRALSLGFYFGINGNDFVVWSGEQKEDSSSAVLGRSFSFSSSHWTYWDRRMDSVYSICIVD